MTSDGAQDSNARRRALLERLRALEREGLRVRAGLAALGPGHALPGVHLLAAVGARPFLVPGGRVVEIARYVAVDPIAGAPPWLLGTFVWRGRPALAVDLGTRLGLAACAGRDAVMVVLDGGPPIALVVDAVRALVEDPVAADGAGTGAADQPLLGACRVGDLALPLLAPEVIEAEARGARLSLEDA